MSNVVIFSPDINIYRGSRRITRDMFPADVRAELPPEGIASLGKLLTLDPKAVSPLVAIRQRVYRTLAAAGTPYLGGFGVGPALAPPTAEKLANLKAEFNTLREKLLKDYATRRDALVLANPKWGVHIANLAGSADEVGAATNFRIRKYRAEIVELPGDNDAANELQELHLKVAEEANATLKGFLTEFLGKDKATQRGLKVLRHAAEKLADLSFLDGALAPKAMMFASLCDKLPKSGTLEGGELDRLKRDIRLLLGETEDTAQSSLFEAEVVI